MAERYTILICDGDRDIVSALDIYLRAEGYRTLLAYSGNEALRLAGDCRRGIVFAAVLADIGVLLNVFLAVVAR